MRWIRISSRIRRRTSLCSELDDAPSGQASGCGARKLQRSFPNGTNGFLTFCLLWLGMSAFIIIVPLKEFNRRPSYYESSPPMSGSVALALVCLGLAVFFVGLIWIRRLMARSRDIVWIR